MAAAVPDFTTCLKRESEATCQRTRDVLGRHPAALDERLRASRVQSDTPLEVGSPDATPSRNG